MWTALQQPNPDYDDPQRYHRITERFLGPGNGDQTLGQLRWDRDGTNPVNAGNVGTETGAGAVKEIRAGAGIGDLTRWDLFNLTIPAVVTGLRMRWRIKVNDIVNTYWHLGVVGSTSNDVKTATNNNFVGFRMDNAVDGNIYGVVKDGAGAGNEDTLEVDAAEAAWHTYELRLGPTACLFLVDGVAIGSVDLSNLPSVGVTPSMRIENLAVAAVKDFSITYFDLISPAGY